MAAVLSGLSCLPWVATADEEGTEERPADPPVLDLAALLRAADHTYPGLRAAEARIRAARARLDEAWVTPFFQSTITAGFGLSPEIRGTPIFSPDNQVPLSNPWQPVLSLQIEGVIPLWTFGKLPAARDAARAGIRAAESDRARVRAQLRYDVRRAYFGLQLALDLEQMLRETLPPLRQALERIEEQLDDDDPEVSDLDRYRLEAALAEVEARASDVARLEQSSRVALTILTGVQEFRIPACPIEAVSLELRPRTYYVSQASANRPEVRMLEAALRAREASLDATEARFYPDLALVYQFGTTYSPGITDQRNPFIIDPANYLFVRAGLVLRWSLDLWGNAYRVDRERALVDDIRERSREAARGLELEVSAAYETARAAAERVEAWGRGRRQSRRWFIAASQGRDIGTLSTRDLVDAARAYITARVSHLTSIQELNQALANLERASGVALTDHWESPCE